jgi:uncharacterized protein YciI
MLFVLTCIDKPNATALRLEVRPRHLKYFEERLSMVKIAGPFLADDGQTMVGSLIILEAPDIAAARGFSANDPYTLAGLFAHVDIRPWRWTVGAPKG